MNTDNLKWCIENININAKRGSFQYAIFDFDGTLSLIREGWQKIMIPYFADELQKTPCGQKLSRQELEEDVREFVFLNTGKQTIYQCIHLAGEIEKLGGVPLQPLEYKGEYHRRLERHIEFRISELEKNPCCADEHMVPGSACILEALRGRGVKMYLASGTDEVYVKHEAEILGIAGYFDGIYGAKDDYRSFSKKMVIDSIISENNLNGSELIGFGDGYVEIENVKSVGGFACGVAADEVNRRGIDQWKRQRLIDSGADIIIPDFSDTKALMCFLFMEG